MIIFDGLPNDLIFNISDLGLIANSFNERHNSLDPTITHDSLFPPFITYQILF